MSLHVFIVCSSSFIHAPSECASLQLQESIAYSLANPRILTIYFSTGEWSSSALEQIISGLGEELAGDRRWAREKKYSRFLAGLVQHTFCAGLQAIAAFLTAEHCGRLLQHAIKS